MRRAQLNRWIPNVYASATDNLPDRGKTPPGAESGGDAHSSRLLSLLHGLRGRRTVADENLPLTVPFDPDNCLGEPNLGASIASSVYLYKSVGTAECYDPRFLIIAAPYTVLATVMRARIISTVMSVGLSPLQARTSQITHSTAPVAGPILNCHVGFFSAIALSLERSSSKENVRAEWRHGKRRGPRGVRWCIQAPGCEETAWRRRKWKDCRAAITQIKSPTSPIGPTNHDIRTTWE